MAEERRVCPHCGANMNLHPHSLNEVLLDGLTTLAKQPGPTNLKHLGLNRNVWDNFQKLRYWDLIRKTYRDGRRRRGVWEMTPKGRLFLTGRARVRRKVVTYRGERVRFEQELVHITDFFPGGSGYEGDD